VIGFLRGRLAAKDPPQILVDVGGVGYEVEAPLSTCFRLPEVGATVELCTHLLIREDQHVLFGFATGAERRLFRDLLKVNGVGARTALGVLSGMSVAAFREAIETADVAALTRLPGVGRKTAERLLVEMRDRVAHLEVQTAGERARPAPDQARGDALDALVALGYKGPEARRLLERVPESVDGTEALLRAALRVAAGGPS
jgi:Holliday junction DNA helicase RuvA